MKKSAIYIAKLLERYEQKKKLYPLSTPLPFISIQNLNSPTPHEIRQIVSQADQYGLSLYRAIETPTPQPAELLRFAVALGLNRFDNHLCANEGVSYIEPVQDRDDPRHGYIPYSTRAIQWHTDGYYLTAPENETQTASARKETAPLIRTLLLHCNRPGAGGENTFMDYEIIFGKLYEKDPGLIEALMEPDCFGIPETVDGTYRRSAIAGPVFQLAEENSGVLHMRYTQRKKNIFFSQKPDFQRALAELTAILGEEQYRLKATLQAGEGVISANIPHCRGAFTGNRQLMRIRSYDLLVH